MSYPPPNSGIPPMAPPPGGAAPAYAPPPAGPVPGQPHHQDQYGRWLDAWNNLCAVPPAAAPPPPPAGYAPPPATVPYGAAPPPGYGGYGAPAGGAGDVAFGEIAWSGGIAIAGTYVIRLEDIEPGVSGTGNAKLVFSGPTLQPLGAVQAGTQHVWSYTLTEKAIGKLGRDVVNAGVNGQTRYPREAHALAAALKSELGGAQLVVRIEEQRDGQGFNTSIVSRYNAGSAAPAVAPPQAPPPTAAAAPVNGAGAPPVTFPPGPAAAPPPGSGGFGSV